MGQLKTLVILPSFDMGGAENYCLRLIAYAPIDRFDWHVTSGNLRNTQMEPLYRDAGVTTHRRSPGYANPKLIWQFWRFLDAMDFDIIMSFNGIFGGLSLLLAKQTGVPVRVGWHRRSTPAHSATLGRRLYSALSLQWFEKSSTRILSNSRAALKHFHGSKWRDNDRYLVIPNGVDANRFRPCAGLGHAVRREFNIPLSSFVIGHIGRLDPAKDHETLLATVRAVRDRGLHARLLVAGTGTDSASFSARLRHYKLEDVTSCLGPRQDVERLYQAMDVFLFPSLTEGQPNALIEAMLSGVKIMASDIEPIREAVPAFLYRSLFAPGDSSGAAALLLTRINDLSDDVERARAWATDYYDPTRNFNAVLEGDRRVMRKLLFAHDDWISFDELNRPTSHNYTRHLVDRYRYLADRVTFAVRCKATSRIEWFEDAVISCIPDVKRARNLARYLSARRSVHELVESHDIVVARLPSLIGSWALRAAWRTRKPVLVEMVGCPWDALWNHSLKGKLVAPWFWAKNRRLLRRTTHTVYVTERFLQERYPTRGTSVACSNVEASLASRKEMRARQTRLQSITETAPVVLGTIANADVAYKGQDLVLRALAELDSESRNRFVYRLIGPGDSSRLRNLAALLGVSDLVEFVGAVNRDAIPAALDDIDVYLQPSLQEGLPRAMIEAMARGCVVIGAKTGGIPELLPPSWVVPRGDWRSIARQLERLSERDLAAASRENWKKASGYQLDNLSRKRQRFYGQFLADHNL